MRAKLLAFVTLTSSLCALSACYPTYLTLRPEAEIFVTDESGAPLEGATVTLGTMEWHGVGGKTSLENFSTDASGKVEFDEKRRWATQIMLPDGDVRYTWSICFSKPGFEAIPLSTVEFDEPIRVKMYASPVSSECEWREHEHGPRVKQREERWIEVAGGQWRSNIGITMLLDESVRDAMDASAREQGIRLHSWSAYRFQYRTGGDAAHRDAHILVRALCRAPEEVDLTRDFYSEPDDGACFFDTKFTVQSWSDQPKASFSPLKPTSSPARSPAGTGPGRRSFEEPAP
jgi:hypothetical protein